MNRPEPTVNSVYNLQLSIMKCYSDHLPVVRAGRMHIQNMFRCERFGLVVSQSCFSYMNSTCYKIVQVKRAGKDGFPLFTYTLLHISLIHCPLILFFRSHFELFTRIILRWNPKHLSVRSLTLNVPFPFVFASSYHRCSGVCEVNIRPFSNNCYLLIQLLQIRREKFYHNHKQIL